MASSPITSWQIVGETMETVTDFFLGSKITAYGDCSHERCLLLGRRATNNLDSTLKNRDITLSTKVCRVKAMVFPVVMYECESWTIKKAEHRRIDAFELWCWGRLLRDPWIASRSNQSILKEINHEYSLEGLMLKVKLQNFGYLMQRASLLEKTLMLGKIEGRWRRVLRVPLTARKSNQSVLKEINHEYSLEGLMLKLKVQYVGHLMQRDDSLENTLILGKTGGK